MISYLFPNKIRNTVTQNTCLKMKIRMKLFSELYTQVIFPQRIKQIMR